MPKPDSKKINRLLGTIRNPKVSEERKNLALQELEGEVNQYATSQENRFKASLSSFEQQWQMFEESQDWLTKSLDSVLSSDVDPDEVNLLMQQIQDEIRLERSNPPSVPSDEELERRLQKLLEFVVPQKPVPSTVKDPLEELENLVDETPSFELDFSFLDDLTDSIHDTELQLEYLEDELDAIPDVDGPKLKQPITTANPSERVTSPPINDTAPIVDRSVNTNPSKHKDQALVQQPSALKSSGSSFLKKIGSFFQSVANFFKNLMFKTVSLEGTINNLQKANKELRDASLRLNQAQDRLSKAVDTVQRQQGQLTTLNAEYQKVAKKLSVQMAALQRLKSSTEINPQKKSEAIKTMQARIAKTRQEFNQKSGAVQRLSSQLESASSRAMSAHSQLKEATQMHKIATCAVKKGISELKKVPEMQQVNIDKQYQIKDLLKKGKAKYQQAEEKRASIEEHGNDTFKFN